MKGNTPISNEDWDGLSAKGQWDIKVALRGPDLQGSEPVKWFTTSVIRGKVRKVMRVGGTVNEDLNLIIIPHGWNKGGSFNASHFLEHVQTAATHLNIPILHTTNISAWETLIGQQITSSSIKAFVEAVRAEPKTKYSLFQGTPEQLKELERHASMITGGQW